MLHRMNCQKWTGQNILHILHSEVTKMQPVENEKEEKMHVVENIKDMVG